VYAPHPLVVMGEGRKEGRGARRPRGSAPNPNEGLKIDVLPWCGCGCHGQRWRVSRCRWPGHMWFSRVGGCLVEKILGQVCCGERLFRLRAGALAPREALDAFIVAKNDQKVRLKGSRRGQGRGKFDPPPLAAYPYPTLHPANPAAPSPPSVQIASWSSARCSRRRPPRPSCRPRPSRCP
jgi:hypothetical protein